MQVTVRGPSMAPALADGDLVVALLGARPRPGDVVLVRWDARPAQLSVKRAVEPEPGTGRWVVRGDNRLGSTDSATLGPAHVDGVVLLRVRPSPRWLRPRRPSRRRA